MNNSPVIELDPEIEALEREVAAARKAKAERDEKQAEAEKALATLVGISREYHGLSVGATCIELRGEMAAVHPEWNRRGRREFVKSFRRKGHK